MSMDLRLGKEDVDFVYDTWVPLVRDNKTQYSGHVGKYLMANDGTGLICNGFQEIIHK
jgi:hypothetical protein